MERDRDTFLQREMSAQDSSTIVSSYLVQRAWLYINLNFGDLNPPRLTHSGKQGTFTTTKTWRNKNKKLDTFVSPPRKMFTASIPEKNKG